jgi:hypothetical protein
MLMARLFRIELPIADLAFVYLVAAMGRTVLDVLVVCFPVGKRTIALVAVRHFGRRGSCRDEELSSMEELMLCMWLGDREEMAKGEFRSSIAGSRRKITVPEMLISVLVGCDPAAAPCCLV